MRLTSIIVVRTMTGFKISIRTLKQLTSGFNRNFKFSRAMRQSCEIIIIKKVNYGYQISSIVIGSLDTSYQFMYLLYLIWLRNA